MSCFHPVPCFVLGNKGYVWDAEGAMRLRKEYRIMGSLLGGVSQFKNQNEVNSLPFELIADEITLALENGWIVLKPRTYEALAEHLEVRRPQKQLKRERDNDEGTPTFSEEDWPAYRAYYRFFDAEKGGFWGKQLPIFNCGDKRRKILSTANYLAKPCLDRDDAGGLCACEQRHSGTPGSTPPEHCAGSKPQTEPDSSEPVWRGALATGSAFTLPLTAAAAASLRRGLKQTENEPATVPSYPSSTSGSKPIALVGTSVDGDDDGGSHGLRSSPPRGRGCIGSTDRFLIHPGRGCQCIAIDKNGIYDRCDDVARDGAVMGASWAEKMAATMTSTTGDEDRHGPAIAGGLISAPGSEGEAGVDDAIQRGAVQCVPWSYPTTALEVLRYAVFRDLHGRGFMMSGGNKFGSDLLAYPGDPALYHAQFTVRLVPPGQPLNPMLLKAAGRGSHAARKHLLLATLPLPEEGPEAEPSYKVASTSTVRPQSGRDSPGLIGCPGTGAVVAPGSTGGINNVNATVNGSPSPSPTGAAPSLACASSGSTSLPSPVTSCRNGPQRKFPTPIYLSIAPEAGFGSKA